MAVFIKKVNIPQKSDLINIDMTGSGTAQTYRVLKNVSGTIYEVMGMTNIGTNQIFDSTSQIYEGSALDTYLNTTWYNTLSSTAKEAIVDKTIQQELWEFGGTGGNSISFNLITGNRTWLKIINEQFGNQITRHCYTISIKDIMNYFEVSFDDIIQGSELIQMIWQTTSAIQSFMWMSDASIEEGRVMRAVGPYGNVAHTNPNDTNEEVRPAFQIDLSKIDYTFTDGRQAVELKPVSILQKSNNALSRVGMSWKQIIYPSKGDIVDIDMTGSGTAQRFRVLKNVSGKVFEVMSMATVTNSAMTTSGKTYEDGPMDTYLNSTWYNTLSNEAKLAIVDKTFRQDSWNPNNFGNPDYTGVNSDNNSYIISFVNANYNEIIRHCYVISIQDVIDYLEVTPQMTSANTTLTYTNLWQMCWNSDVAVSESVWTRSAYYDLSNGDFVLRGNGGNIYSQRGVDAAAVRPAFQIDLSKIDFTIE